MHTGQYAGLDKDLGDTIYYSASNSHDNLDKDNPIVTHATKGLQRSYTERRAIRVLRNAGGDAAYSPAVGLRYDGLYRIVDREIKKNYKGGAYLRFKLVREGNQAKIDLTRPNARERGVFERLKAEY